MKTVLKYLNVSLLVLTGALVAYFLCAVVLTLMPANGGYKAPENGVEIFLRSNGTHVDLALPVSNETHDWRAFVPLSDFEPHRQQPFQFVSFGWGEKAFYLNTPTWDDMTVSTVLHATLIPSASAMHVTYLENTPKTGHLCNRVLIAPEAYAELCEFVKQGFQQDANGRLIPIELDGYANVNDKFYEGVGDYHAFTTCNDWTNRGLKTAGVRTAQWAAFERSVFYHIEE